MKQKRIVRAVCGTVAVLGVSVAFAGLVLCMCETQEVADQIRNMAAGLALITCGSALTYMSGSAHWRKEPYAGL